MQKFLLLVLENIKHQKQSFNAIIIEVKGLILQSPPDWSITSETFKLQNFDSH